MSATTHTPGPWILRPSQHVLPGCYQVTTNGEPLTLGFVCHDIPAGESNARLIAAAPELLDALQRAAEALHVAELYVATAPADQFDRDAQTKSTRLVQSVAKEVAAAIAKATA